MPLYEYECNDCEHRFERIQKFSDPLVSTCPVCDGEVRKLLSSPAIQFKGTGWYVTDYAKKPSGDQPSGAAGDPKDGGKKDGGSTGANGKDAGASTSKDASSSTTKTESTASSTKSSSGTAAAR
ncbi:MAG: zinc ribbon domain-containing protein [Acidobacteria bacterium]|nr:zinc ribbon domain-containing protein [Acidobacteriota bacterium]MCY4634497.1 zinc ribbon domain-containing protein [Acidobacteriota bacterium]